jgi:hypothetical protein
MKNTGKGETVISSQKPVLGEPVYLSRELLGHVWAFRKKGNKWESWVW